MTRWKPDAQGRLITAALELFSEQGYDATTVTEIAERAGLTKRTFFRHFTDKREVLFQGSQDLEALWLEALEATPDSAGPMEMVGAGFGPVADLFAERHAFARIRSAIIFANPELQERELIKLERLAGSIQAALTARGVARHPATLAAQAGVTIFHVAFARWLEQDDPDSFRHLMGESLEELRAVTAAPVSGAAG